jgi:hypothetical protein
MEPKGLDVRGLIFLPAGIKGYAMSREKAAEMAPPSTRLALSEAVRASRDMPRQDPSTSLRGHLRAEERKGARE